MTQNERLENCRMCENHKLDLNRGIICKLSGLTPDYVDECQDYKVSQEYVGQVHELEDKIQKDSGEISGLLAFYLYWMIPLGAVFSLLALFNIQFEYYPNSYLVAFEILNVVFFACIGVYTIYAFVKRRQDAVFMAKYHLIFVFASNLLVVLMEVGTWTNFIPLVWSSLLFLFMTISQNVKALIPEETRKLTSVSRVLVPVSIIVPLLLFVIGIAELF